MLTEKVLFLDQFSNIAFPKWDSLRSAQLFPLLIDNAIPFSFPCILIPLSLSRQYVENPHFVVFFALHCVDQREHYAEYMVSGFDWLHHENTYG